MCRDKIQPRTLETPNLELVFWPFGSGKYTPAYDRGAVDLSGGGVLAKTLAAQEMCRNRFLCMPTKLLNLLRWFV